MQTTNELGPSTPRLDPRVERMATAFSVRDATQAHRGARCGTKAQTSSVQESFAHSKMSSMDSTTAHPRAAQRRAYTVARRNGLSRLQARTVAYAAWLGVSAFPIPRYVDSDSSIRTSESQPTSDLQRKELNET